MSVLRHQEKDYWLQQILLGTISKCLNDLFKHACTTNFMLFEKVRGSVFSIITFIGKRAILLNKEELFVFFFFKKG